MMSACKLLESCLGEALKIDVHILNRVPSKSLPKTSFELWTKRKVSLNQFYIWGCPAKAKINNT